MGVEKKLVGILKKFPEFWLDEDGNIHDLDLDLTGTYTQNIKYNLWMPSELGYNSLGNVDSLSYPYVDFGDFHSRGCPESFIIKNEERRFHPVMAFMEIQKELKNLIRDLTDLRNELVNYYG